MIMAALWRRDKNRKKKSLSLISFSTFFCRVLICFNSEWRKLCIATTPGRMYRSASSFPCHLGGRDTSQQSQAIQRRFSPFVNRWLTEWRWIMIITAFWILSLSLGRCRMIKKPPKGLSFFDHKLFDLFLARVFLPIFVGVYILHGNVPFFFKFSSSKLKN